VKARAALAGPALIVAAVLIVLHDVAFRGMVSNQHPDLLAFWLPNHCFLGKSLAAGRIPAWNPYSLGGTPFAADPQSGWLYLPAMALYAALPCHVAIRWFVVLQPLVGGLGLYLFLRTEDLSRPAATVGGVALALAVASSLLAVYLPFAGALAWTAMLLATAAKVLRARAWPARLGWIAAVAVAWGQLASAHATNGLVLGTGVLLAYAAARLAGDVRRGTRTLRATLGLIGLLLAALLSVNLAILLPRLAYVPRTTMGLGFGHLEALAASLGGGAAPAPKVGPGAPAAWPLQLSLWPGLYLGALTLALAFAAWWTRRRRAVAAAFSAYGAITYLLSLDVVARALAPAFRALPFGALYLHSPWRFRLGLLVALPVLAAVGVEAWREAVTPRVRVAMVAPGLAVWVILPLVVVGPGPLAFTGAAAVWTAVALAAAARRASALPVLPVVLAVELMVAALLGQAAGTESGWAEFAPTGTSTRPFTNLLQPDVDAAAYARPGPIAEALADLGPARFAGVEPSLAQQPRGILLHQDPSYWGLMSNGRAMLFGLEDAQGYNPVQLLRYWSFGRAANPEAIDYNSAVFAQLTPPVRRLLQVDLAAAAVARPPVPDAREIAEEGWWAGYALPEPSARASVVTDWTVVPDSRAALREVLDPAFDPSAVAILEDQPGMAPSGAGPGRAAYQALGPQAARVEVEAPGPALLVVRNVHDPGWQATVDGRPAPVLVTDALIQAVPVPGGRHTVVLAYDDPWTGYGLLGSGLTLGALLGAALLSRARGSSARRRGRPRRSPPPPAPGTASGAHPSE
jgi:hypothetical protein